MASSDDIKRAVALFQRELNAAEKDPQVRKLLGGRPARKPLLDSHGRKISRWRCSGCGFQRIGATLSGPCPRCKSTRDEWLGYVKGREGSINK